MSIFGELGNIVKDVVSVAKPVLGIGGAVYSYTQASKRRKAYEKYLRQVEDQNYADQSALRDYLMARDASRGGGGGGGGGGGPSISPEAIQQNIAMQQDFYNKIRSIYQPYHDVGVKMLPQQSESYGEGLKLLGELAKQYAQPEQVAQARRATPLAQNVNVPLPSYLRSS